MIQDLREAEKMKHFLRVVEDDTVAIFRSGIGMPDTTVEG